MSNSKKTDDSMHVHQKVRLELKKARELDRELDKDPHKIQKTIDENWPAFRKAIREVGIRNYSTFLKGRTLFISFDYVGPAPEYEDRMEQLENAPRIQECLLDIGMPLKTQATGEWRIPCYRTNKWLATNTKEIYHQD